MSVLQQTVLLGLLCPIAPFAAPGRVCSVTGCAVPGRFCSVSPFAAPGRGCSTAAFAVPRDVWPTIGQQLCWLCLSKRDCSAPLHVCLQELSSKEFVLDLDVSVHRSQYCTWRCMVYKGFYFFLETGLFVCFGCFGTSSKYLI